MRICGALPIWCVPAQRACLALSVIAAFAGAARGQLSIHGVAAIDNATRQVVHVNAELGHDDTGDGSLLNPWKTLNHALQRAWDVNSQQTLVFISTIEVHQTVTPIAPLYFGGYEASGWVATGESPRKAFPIRMLGHVNVVGVPARSGALPVITIDEIMPNVAYADWTGGVGEQKSVILGAADCKLESFAIDGSKLINSSDYHSDWPGVRVRDANDSPGTDGFTLSYCNIGKWHHEVYLDAASDANVATIDHCTIHDAWPFTNPLGTLGHAGIWMTGTHSSDVTVTATNISTCHDGLEFAGETLVSGATATLAITACCFHDNENGLELVGPDGAVTLTADTTNFINTYAKGSANGGVDGLSSPCGAIVLRNDPGAKATVRTCDFHNGGFGVYWKTVRSDNSLDLGQGGYPSAFGLNTFCLDFSAFPNDASGNPTDPFRVCVYYEGPNTASAVANFWIRNDQGADANGYLAIGSQTPTDLTTANLYDYDCVHSQSITLPRPPGPAWGEFQCPPAAPNTPWRRNYSIGVGKTIDFGIVSPSTLPPDCATAPTCPTTP